MTNTVYTLSTIKKEPSTIDAPEYMDINSDEAEAGSILMSLSQQSKRSERSTTTNTMSIRNLLEDNDERTSSHQEQLKMNGLPLADSTRSSIVHRYPEAAKEEPQAYGTGMHGHHSVSTIFPDTSTPMEYTAQRQSESYDWQHQRQTSYNAQQYPYYQQERYHQHPTHHQQQQQEQQQQQQQHHHHQPIRKPYNRYDPQQQPYQSMRKHPKVRRNALHAYISYMTYTDLKRIKANAPHLQQPYNAQLMTKKSMQSSSTPLPKHPAASTSSSVQQKNHHHHHHHQPPLTAFLKDTIDSTVPATPIPRSSLPPIESHRRSNDWPDQHYQTSPPPPHYQSPPSPSRYRPPYPTSSFSTK